MKWKGETADDRSDIFNDPLRVVNAFDIKESCALQQLFQKPKAYSIFVEIQTMIRFLN